MTLTSNEITLSKYGANLINDVGGGSGYGGQIATVTGNTVNAYGGVFMGSDSISQIVTVSGNTFNTSVDTVNPGSGICVGPQCAP